MTGLVLVTLVSRDDAANDTDGDDGTHDLVMR
jgi:hypothetical protein